MNSFFRHIFFFTKSQKRGLIVLIVLLILVVVANMLIPKYLRKTKPLYSDNSVFLSQVDSFKNSLSDKEYKYGNTYSPADFADARYDMASSAVRLFDFDPNTLDSGGFVALGLKPFVAKNIVNYRNKGGRFRRADDFARVYGLLPADFTRLKPYIHIADTKENKSDLQTIQSIDKQTENASRKVEDNIVVELNTADTAALRQLHGIGNYYARQIVYYRDKLLEIKNFPVQTFERIKNNLTVDPDLIKKINVNWATVEKLNRHPYLNFYQSKAIFELRKKQKLQSIDDFRQISDFSDEDLKNSKIICSLNNFLFNRLAINFSFFLKKFAKSLVV